MLTTRERLALAAVDPAKLQPGDMARLAADLGVSRQRVHQILKAAPRKRQPDKLEGLLPSGMSRAQLAQEIGLSYRSLTALIRPGPPAGKTSRMRWAPRIARALRQPTIRIVERLRGG